METVECHICKGVGQVLGEACPRCEGTGKLFVFSEPPKAAKRWYE